jgi:hypothetical protein
VIVDKFWQKAHDIHTVHYAHYKHSLLTEEEKRQTVVVYLHDVVELMSEWYTSKDDTKK